MAKLTKAQLKSFRFFRNKGFSIKEARRVARLTYSQLADELSRELKRQSDAKLTAHRAKHMD